MNFNQIQIFLLLIIIYTNFIFGSEHDNEEEHEHHDGEIHDDHFDGHHGRSHDSHYFDEDPHDEDPDYDEDVLTGTSHHVKRDVEKTKKDIEDLFKKMDKNSDGKVGREELLLHLTLSMKQLHNETTNEEFLKVDSDKNKKVSLDEFFIFEHNDPSAVMENITNADNSSDSLYLRKRIQHEKNRFKAADHDGDGFLSEQEYLLFKYPVFFPHMAHTVVHNYLDDLDTNNDGTIDEKEYLDHFHIDDSKDKDAKERSLKKAKEDFAKYDKDKNGKIDAKEYHEVLKPGYEEPARSEADFLIKESDSNKDGLLTLEEVEKHSHSWLGGEPIMHHDEDDDDDDYYPHHLDDEL